MNSASNFTLEKQGVVFKLAIGKNFNENVHGAFRVCEGLPFYYISQEGQVFISQRKKLWIGPKRVDNAMALENLVVFNRGEEWFYQNYNTGKEKLLGRQIRLAGEQDFGDYVFIREEKNGQKILSIAYEKTVRSWKIDSFETVCDVRGEKYLLIQKSGEKYYKILNCESFIEDGTLYRLLRRENGTYAVFYRNYWENSFRIILEINKALTEFPSGEDTISLDLAKGVVELEATTGDYKYYRLYAGQALLKASGRGSVAIKKRKTSCGFEVKSYEIQIGNKVFTEKVKS